MSNGQLFAIDHGQALPSVQGVTGKSLPFPIDSHLGWDTVTRQPGLLHGPIDDLRRLTNATIDSAVAAVPASWWTAPDRAAAVCLALRRRRDELPGKLEELAERLR